MDGDTGEAADQVQRPRTSIHRRNEILQAAYDKLDEKMDTAPLDDDDDLLGFDNDLMDQNSSSNPLENTGKLDFEALKREQNNFKAAVDHLKP